MPTREEKIAFIIRKQKEDFIKRRLQETPTTPDTTPDKSLGESALETVSDYLQSIGKGASFGLTDELAGAVGAAIDPVVTSLIEKDVPEDLKEKPKPITERYQEARDYAREQQKLSAERSPITSTIGEMQGALTSGLATGAASIPGLAAEGALYGLGESEADLTKGELGEAAKDVLKGAAIGAGTGALTKGAGKAYEKFLKPKLAKKSTQLAEKGTGQLLETTPMDRVKLKQSGVSLPSKEKANVLESLPQYLKEKGFKGNFDQLSGKVNQALKESGENIEKVADIYDDFFKKIIKDNPEFEEAAKTLKKNWDRINNYDFNKVADELEKDVLSKIKDMPGYKTQAANVEKYIEELKDLGPVSSLKDLNKIRQQTDKLIKWAKKEPSMMDEVYQTVRTDISNHIKNKMLPNFDKFKNVLVNQYDVALDQKTLKETADTIYKANYEYTMGSKVKDMLKKAEGRAQNRRGMGLTDNQWTLGGLLGSVGTGSPLPLLAPIAKKAADVVAPKARLYAPELMRGAEKGVSSLVEGAQRPFIQQATKKTTNPEYMSENAPERLQEKWSNTKYQKFFKGDSKQDAVNHKVLMSQDPEYKKMYMNQEDED